MNTGFLTNPAPDNGYDAVLAALAPHAAPAEGTLGGTTPSVHNRVKQTFINPVATYPFIARKWTQGWEQSFHAGDLMFIFTGRGTDQSDEVLVHTRRHSVLANLPVLNHIMRLALQGDVDFQKFKHPESWTFIGVMRNSSAASGLNPRDIGPRGGNALAPDRIINIDVRGSTRMFNYWENARAGAHVWLAWRELNLGSDYSRSLDPMATGVPKRKRGEALKAGTRVVYQTTAGFSAQGQVARSSDDEYTIRAQGGGEVTVPADAVSAYDRHRCWQLLPMTEGRPPAHRSDYRELKVWWSEQTIESSDYKRPICAGWVFQGLGAGELSDDAVAIRKATQVGENRFRLPMIHTFLHV